MKPYCRGTLTYPKWVTFVTPHETVTLSKAVDVELTAREAPLLLDYIFVLETELQQLRRFAGKSGYHTFKTQDHTLAGFIADIAHWSKAIHDPGLVDELDELCVRLDDAYFYSNTPFRL